MPQFKSQGSLHPKTDTAGPPQAGISSQCGWCMLSKQKVNNTITLVSHPRSDVCQPSEKVKVLVDQSCWTLCDPIVCSPQAPLSMGFSRQEYWSGLPFPLPGDLADPGIKNRSPALQADSLSSEPPGKSQKVTWLNWRELPTLAQMCYFLTSTVSHQD